jgi:hypothetical protein
VFAVCRNVSNVTKHNNADVGLCVKGLRALCAGVMYARGTYIYIVFVIMNVSLSVYVRHVSNTVSPVHHVWLSSECRKLWYMGPRHVCNMLC